MRITTNTKIIFSEETTLTDLILMLIFDNEEYSSYIYETVNNIVDQEGATNE